MKYIDADRLKELLSNKYKEFTEKSKNFCFMQYQFMADGLTIAEQMVDSLQQEQPDFPTTDEQVKEILATHPKVEVPNKYKTPDWLWKKQEQPEVDLEEGLTHLLAHQQQKRRDNEYGKAEENRGRE